MGGRRERSSKHFPLTWTKSYLIFLLTLFLLIFPFVSLEDRGNFSFNFSSNQSLNNENVSHLYSIKDIVVLRKCCKPQYTFENGGCVPSKKILLTKSDSAIYKGSDEEYLKIPKHLISNIFANNSKELRFSLKEGLPDCGNGSFLLTIDLRESANPSKATNFTPAGHIKHGSEYYSPNEYCIDSVREDRVTIAICNPECGNPQKPCLPRCCDFGEVLDFSDGIKCRPSGINFWSPTIYSDQYDKLPEKEAEKIFPHITTINPRNLCDRKTFTPYLFVLKEDPEHPLQLFRLLANGNVTLKVSRRKWEIIPKHLWCIDGAQNYASEYEEGQLKLYSGNSEKDTALVECRNSTGDEGYSKPIWTNILYATLMSISSVFLFLTSFVYILLFEKQNIHGWTLLSHFLSMFFLYVFLTMTNIYSIYSRQDTESATTGSFCFFLSVGSHFFFLSTFCWMTLINFDFYFTFRSLKPTSGKSKGAKRFLFYCIFAIGIPLVIVVVGLVLDNIYGNVEESEVIVPHYARTSCFMDSEYAVLPYLYGPIAVLLTSNIIFFVATVYFMHKIQQTTKFATTNSSKKQKQGRLIFAKLFLVMGVTWILELINWLIHKDALHWWVIIVDIGNIFQAVAIFIIFICKSEIFVNLKQKYPSLKWVLKTPTRRPTMSMGTTMHKRRADTYASEMVTDNTVTEHIEMN